MGVTTMRPALRVLCAAALLSGCSGAGSAGVTADLDRGDVVFFDDFSGPALERSSWNVVVSGF